MRAGECDENVEEGEGRQDRHQEELGEAAGAGKGLQRNHDDRINGHLTWRLLDPNFVHPNLSGAFRDGRVSCVDHLRCQLNKLLKCTV